MQQVSFRTLMQRQIARSIFLTLLLSIPITLLAAYITLQQQVKSDIETLQSISHDLVNQHLKTGWQSHNVRHILQNLGTALPNAQFTMHKAPQFRSLSENVHLDQLSAPYLKDTINHIEHHQTSLTQTNLIDGYLSGGFPVFFEDRCLKCHATEVKQGQIQSGSYAGSVAFSLPISTYSVSVMSILVFIMIFVLSFVGLFSIIQSRILQAHLINPLLQLANRIQELKLTSVEKNIRWQRQHHLIQEVDEIDHTLTDHIRTLQGIYNKLDALVIIEHESGMFHKQRFNEVMKYELFRSHRYDSPFSILLVQLIHCEACETAQSDTDSDSLNHESVQAFSHLLMAETRSTDLVFRIDEKLFAIIAPETDQAGVFHMQVTLDARFKDDVGRTSLSNEKYEFKIQSGTATYGEDGTTGKELMHAASERMR